MSRRSGEAAKADNHSDISPFRVNDLRAVSNQIIPRRPRSLASSTSPLNPAVYGSDHSGPCSEIVSDLEIS